MTLVLDMAQMDFEISLSFLYMLCFLCSELFLLLPLILLKITCSLIHQQPTNECVCHSFTLIPIHISSVT